MLALQMVRVDGQGTDVHGGGVFFHRIVA
jgi:hypothetical protein